MYELALFSSNIYIESTALKHSINHIERWTIVATHILALGGKINAVKNREERHGRHVNS